MKRSVINILDLSVEELDEGAPAGELTPEQRMAKGRADAKALNKKEDK